MNLLVTVQRFCKRTNLDSPTTVIGNADPQVQQILSLLEEEGNDLTGRGDWQELTNEAIHATTGVTGTTTSAASFFLLDTGATFLSDNLAIGNAVTNSDTGATSTILAIIHDGALALNDEIFTGIESYSILTENQGAIKDIASNGYRYIKNGTFWDRTLELPVVVLDGVGWQQEIATRGTSFLYQVRIRGGDLIANPVPAVGHTWAFEYMTWNWITDSAGANPIQYFTDDTDLMLLPEAILMMGLRWRWKKEKGFEYAEDMRTYELLVANALSRDGMNKPLTMSKRRRNPRPKISVPDSSWNV